MVTGAELITWLAAGHVQRFCLKLAGSTTSSLILVLRASNHHHETWSHIVSVIGAGGAHRDHLKLKKGHVTCETPVLRELALGLMKRAVHVASAAVLCWWMVSQKTIALLWFQCLFHAHLSNPNDKMSAANFGDDSNWSDSYSINVSAFVSECADASGSQLLLHTVLPAGCGGEFVPRCDSWVSFCYCETYPCILKPLRVLM